MSDISKYDIPVISVEGETLPEAWEKGVLETWQRGVDVKTEYDKDGDPPSKDATLVMTVREPGKEPRIHRAFPGGLEDLEVYRQEVVDGVHDHWINPREGKWTYTYHKRLFQYEIEGSAIDQMDYIVEKLSEAPHSRRAQAITWNPKLDPPTEDPPCLQRLWFRLLPAEDDGFRFNMNTHWRSRDGYKAAFMNIFALTSLQMKLAGELAKRIGAKVEVGRYVDISDSFHIYGSYKDEFRKFLDSVNRRTFQERTWPTDFALPFFEEARKRLLAEVK